MTKKELFGYYVNVKGFVGIDDNSIIKKFPESDGWEKIIHIEVDEAGWCEHSVNSIYDESQVRVYSRAHISKITIVDGTVHIDNGR